LNATLITTGGCRGFGRRVGGVELRRIAGTDGTDAGCGRAGGPGGARTDDANDDSTNDDSTNDHTVHGDCDGLNRHIRRQPGILA